MLVRPGPRPGPGISALRDTKMQDSLFPSQSWNKGFHIGAAAAGFLPPVSNAGGKMFLHSGWVKDFATGGKTALVFFKVGFASASKIGLDQ